MTSSEQYLFQPYLQIVEYHSLHLEYLLEENAILQKKKISEGFYISQKKLV